MHPSSFDAINVSFVSNKVLLVCQMAKFENKMNNAVHKVSRKKLVLVTYYPGAYRHVLLGKQKAFFIIYKDQPTSSRTHIKSSLPSSSLTAITFIVQFVFRWFVNLSNVVTTKCIIHCNINIHFKMVLLCR